MFSSHRLLENVMHLDFNSRHAAHSCIFIRVEYLYLMMYVSVVTLISTI